MFNENTPRELEEMRALSQASNALADMLAEIMLESNAPEEIKLGVRIVQQGKKVCTAVQKIVAAFAGDPAGLKPSDTETLEQVLEYLGLVEVGLKHFMKTTNAPNANSAPNEI